MADTSTIASLATAGGTLILAVATFASTRSANRAARATEQSLKIGLRPVLFNARPQDPAQKVGWMDGHWALLPEGYAAIQEVDEKLYMAMPLRNVAAGLAVLDAWFIWPERPDPNSGPRPVEDFRRLGRDLYVPAGDVSFWQAAIREPADELYAPVRESIQIGRSMCIDLLYGDHEGGQRTITRFTVGPRSQPDAERPWLWVCSTARHWNLDREDPR